MKKFFYLVVAAYITCLGFVGCSKNSSAPVVTFADGIQAVVNLGDSKEVIVAIESDAKLKEVKYFKRKEGAEATPIGSPISKFTKPKKYASTITIRDIMSNVVLVVEATDKKGRTTTAEFLIKIDGLSAAAGFQNGLRMGFNMLNSVGSSYSVNQGKVLLLAQAKQSQADVDFMFFFGKNNGVTIAAPSDEVVNHVFNNKSCGVQTWETRNATRFVKVALDYENSSAEDIYSALQDNTTTSVNHLSNGDVVAFRTASGQMGLVKISNIGPNSASTFNANVRTI